MEITFPSIDFNVLMQPALVFGWAMVLLVMDLFITDKRTTGWLALGGVVAIGLLGMLQLRPDSAFVATASDMIGIDNYALTFNWIFLGVAAISILLSLDYLPKQGIERGEYYVLMLFATGAMMLLAQGLDLIVLFLGLELLSITLYVLAGFAYPRISSEEAAMKYLLIGAFAAGFLVFGIALVYGATGTSNLALINSALAQNRVSADDRMILLIGTALVIVGFGYKIAMAPFHMWTPDVYEGSPTPVTAFMSVGTKAAGFAALARFLLLAVPAERATWLPALAVLAAITLIVGNVAALAQTNVKRMLAYSSVGHAGYILTGMLAGTNAGVASMLFYLVAYAFTNLGAFAVLIALEKRGEAAWDLDDLAGLWSRDKFLTVVMTLCMLSLAGVPLTAGFFGKFYVFTAAWEAGLVWLVIVGVVASAIAAFFYLRIVAQMFMRDPVRDVQPQLPRSLSIGLVVAMIGILLFGIIPTPIVALAEQSVLALTR